MIFCGSTVRSLKVLSNFTAWLYFLRYIRDIAGGDIFFTEQFENSHILSVIDCTGHGIPGAFMTMIASSGMRKIVKDEGCHDPAEILRRLNVFVKTTLQQDTAHALSDDGMDAGVVRIQFQQPHDKNRAPYLTFSGAKLPLFYVQNNEVRVVKGDKQSMGYRRSDIHYEFTNHTIAAEKGMAFYMATDGYTDQFGGQNNKRFSTRRFRKLVLENSMKPFEEQREILLRAFNEHKGKNEQQDDMTIVGFGF